MSSIYLLSVFLTAFTVTFELEPLAEHKSIELTMDFAIIFDICLNFFTGYLTENGYEESIMEIIKHYVFGYFVIDILGCAPGLVTWEATSWLYCFKFLRYF